MLVLTMEEDSMSNKKRKEQCYTELVKWIRKHGGFVHNALEICGSDDNRSIRAKEDIPKNEVIVQVPDKLCLKQEMLDEIPDINQVDTSNYCATTKLVLIMMYHLQLGHKSFYSVYLESLPTYKSFSYHPVYNIGEDNFEKFKLLSKELTQDIETQIKFINNVYEEAQKITAISSEFKTIDKVKYAYLLVSTRRWESTVPLCDLFLHNNRSSMIKMCERGKHQYTTDRLFKKGDTLYINYGNQPDLKLFTQYGFIQDDKESQKMVFPFLIQLNKESTLDILIQAEVQKFFKKYGDTYYLNRHEIPVNFKKVLRIFALSHADLKVIDLQEEYYNDVISTENEINMYNRMYRLMRDKELRYSQSEIDNCRRVMSNPNSDQMLRGFAHIQLLLIELLQINQKFLLSEWAVFLHSRCQQQEELCLV